MSDAEKDAGQTCVPKCHAYGIGCPCRSVDSDGGSEITIPAHWALDSDGSWHHVGVTFDGQTVAFYIDGRRVTPPGES